MKCTYCRSCLQIKRVEFENIVANYLICFLCGRIFYSNPWKAVEVIGEEGEKIRNYFGLTKVGEDEPISESS